MLGSFSCAASPELSPDHARQKNHRGRQPTAVHKPRRRVGENPCQPGVNRAFASAGKTCPRDPMRGDRRPAAALTSPLLDPTVAETRCARLRRAATPLDAGGDPCGSAARPLDPSSGDPLHPAPAARVWCLDGASMWFARSSVCHHRSPLRWPSRPVRRTRLHRLHGGDDHTAAAQPAGGLPHWIGAHRFR